MYFAFFVIVGAAAYGLILTTDQPDISLQGDALSNNETVELAGQSYDLSVSSSSGELSFLNESAVVRNTIDNGSTVPQTDVVFDDQPSREELTLEAGSTVTINDTGYDVSLNGSAGSVTLTSAANASENMTLSAGDTLTYQGTELTLTAVTTDAATLVGGPPYLVVVQTQNVTDPTTAAFVAQPDAGGNQTGNETGNATGNETGNATGNATQGPTERHTVSESDTLQYQGNETTVAEISNESVVLTHRADVTETISLAEGENVSLGGEQYFAHFPTNSTVMVLPTDERYGDYRAETDRIANYDDRIVGLWGVAQLSALAAIILLATAYLPVRG